MIINRITNLNHLQQFNSQITHAEEKEYFAKKALIESIQEFRLERIDLRHLQHDKNNQQQALNQFIKDQTIEIKSLKKQMKEMIKNQ